MSQALKRLSQALRNFMREEDGAQVIEYALIIAVVSIALVVALSTLLTGTSNGFTTFIGRVAACLSGGTCA